MENCKGTKYEALEVKEKKKGLNCGRGLTRIKLDSVDNAYLMM